MKADLKLDLRSRAEYAAIVKPLLPPEAFAPSMRKLWQIGLHLAIIGVCLYGVRVFPNIAVRIALAAVIGHSLTCLVFLAHELSHGGIMRRNPLRYPLEVFLWGLNLIPATMWRKLHNENHHVHANTLNDPDRYFRRCEFDEPGGLWRRWYARLTMPHRFTSRWNLGVGFHFVTYIVRHLATVFYPGKRRPAIVTFKPDYRPADRWWILFELLCITGFQYLIYLAVGRSVVGWLCAGPIALLFTSTFAMSYIWTNHYLHGLHELHDPLLGSTSISVPKFFDKLHSNFSYHTEHHLFPGMNSEYYPLVGEILREQFPERYQRISYRQAWRQLWRGEPFIVEETVAGPVADAPDSALAGPHGELRGAPQDARAATPVARAE